MATKEETSAKIAALEGSMLTPAQAEVFIKKVLAQPPALVQKTNAAPDDGPIHAGSIEDD